MGEVRATSIVLKAVDYREYDKLLSLLTPSGRLTALIKGVKKPNAKLKSSAMIFNLGEYIFADTGGHLTVISGNSVESFYPLTDNLNLFYCANVVAETALRFIQEQEECGQFFLLVAKTLQFLTYENKKTNPYLVLIRFLLSATALCGYKINLTKCCVCGNSHLSKLFFDNTLGGLICSNCVQPTSKEINILTLNALRLIASNKYDTIHLLNLEPNLISSCLSVVSSYIADNIVKLLTIDEVMKLI